MNRFTGNLLRISSMALGVTLLSFLFSCALHTIPELREFSGDKLAEAAPSGLRADEQHTIDIYKKASPTVVNITSMSVGTDIFLNPVPQQGMGSGVILTADGYILTNVHVVIDSEKLEVTLQNGKVYKAKFVGGDVSKDTALIKIDTQGESLPFIQMADSNALQVGQTVYAIGNPFGLKSTLTTGVISSLGRTLKAQNGRVIENVIQTDAAINPGNSGGALLNSSGQLIGINTAIFSPTGTNAGIGFAIPANTARRIANDLIQVGRVIRPYLGIQVGLEINPVTAEALHLPVDYGLMVTQVVPNAPAARAGVRSANKELVIGNRSIPLGQDIIIAYDGQKATTTEHFINYVESKRPGDSITLRVARSGQSPSDITVKLEERPQNQE